MRRTLSVLLALLPAPAMAALPAVTVTRTLSAPDYTQSRYAVCTCHQTGAASFAWKCANQF